MVYIPRGFGGPARPIGPLPIEGGPGGPRLPLRGGLPVGAQPLPPSVQLQSYHKGGKVKKTGPAILKKGERVLTAKQDKARISPASASRIRAKAKKMMGGK